MAEGEPGGAGEGTQITAQARGWGAHDRSGQGSVWAEPCLQEGAWPAAGQVDREPQARPGLSMALLCT